MAGQWTGHGGGSTPHGPGVSRTGSLEPDTVDETSGLLGRQDSHHRSFTRKKPMELQDVVGSRHPSMESLTDQHPHLHPSGYPTRHPSRSSSPRRGRSPVPTRRSPSPQRHPHHANLHQHPHQHDIGFSDTVSNVVEMVKHDVRRPGRIRGSWSASTSPARSPSPTHGQYYTPRPGGRQYCTTSLEQRSRSPSPLGGRTMPSSGPPRGGTLPYPPHHHHPRDHHHHHEHHHHHHHPHQHSYPVLVQRRRPGRRLPPTPSKPSTLQLRPASINFPKLNASPTHCPMPAMGPQPAPPPASCPLSFEQAVAMGRSGRMLPSPVPNGYKPGQQRRTRHSDSDEDDWC